MTTNDGCRPNGQQLRSNFTLVGKRVKDSHSLFPVIATKFFFGFKVGTDLRLV